MDKAKAAVNDFMSKSGHHDTTVHETVSPAVKNEVVKPHVHEEINTAIDKEVHQDHYHRTVQPVHDREVLPEQHTAKLGAVQHREFDHRDHDNTKRSLATEQAQFRDQRVVSDTTHSQSANAAVGGEHVHHHIHETIQPVVHKETVQPSVVHTTVPIHEVHHNAAKVHETSELPAMTMADFKQKGGVLGGREERNDGFEGEPKHIGGTLKNMMDGKTSTSTTSKRDSVQDNTSAGHLGGAGTGVGSGVGSGGMGSGAKSGLGAGAGAAGLGAGAGAAGLGSGNYGDKLGRETSTSSDTTNSKPSLLDRLNPMKDTNNDGKKGIMN